MSDYYILTKNKEIKVVPLLEWAEWIGKVGNKIVKQENVGKYWVSTVFLGLIGLNHNFSGIGEPLLFETMVFPRKKGEERYRELDMDRYATWEDSKKGHKEMVKKWSKI